MKFKIGDRVEIVKHNGDCTSSIRVGHTGTVIGFRREYEDLINIHWDHNPSEQYDYYEDYDNPSGPVQKDIWAMHEKYLDHEGPISSRVIRKIKELETRWKERYEM